MVANRIAGYYEADLRRTISIESGAWIDEAPERKGRTFDVGFKDNRDPAIYNARCGTLAERLSADGWEVVVLKGNQHGSGRCDTLYVTLPREIEARAREIYSVYLKAIGSE